MDQITKAGVWCVNESDTLGISAEDQVFNKAGLPEYNPDGTRKLEPTFHEVNEQGETVAIHYRAWKGLRRAKAAEIPAARIQGVTPQQLADLGYETYDESGNKVEGRRLIVPNPSPIRVVSSFQPARQ